MGHGKSAERVVAASLVRSLLNGFDADHRHPDAPEQDA